MPGTPVPGTGFSSGPQMPSVQGGGTGVFDVVEARGFGDPPCLRRADAELKPEAARACRDRLARVLRAELGPAEDVDHVDGFVDLSDRRHAGDAEHLVAVGPHRDHAVALLQEVGHDAVALA